VLHLYHTRMTAIAPWRSTPAPFFEARSQLY